MWTDVVYVILLFLCVAVGVFYQKIEDPHVKKWICTIIGFALVIIVSGTHLLHPLIVTLINAFIITKLPPKYDTFISYNLLLSQRKDITGMPINSPRILSVMRCDILTKFRTIQTERVCNDWQFKRAQFTQRDLFIMQIILISPWISNEHH